MKPLKNLPFKFQQIKQNYTKGHSGVRFIIVHDTGNRSRGADARSHYNYFNGRYVGASANYFVDDKQIIQTVSDYHTSWHCGDNQGYGRALNGAKNSNSIGVEICINSDGNYELAVANALELVKNLQKIHGVPDSRVQRHYDVSRKRCPGTMSSNNWARWKQFKRDLKKPMILKIDTRKNSTATTVSGGSTSNDGSPSSGFVWYGDGSPHNNKSGVQKLQKDLVKLGYSVGSWGTNGVWGNDTRGAVRKFQKDHGLTVDGQAGKETLSKMKKLIDAGKPLSLGSRGDRVVQLQKDLIELGYGVGKVEANGNFGNLTEKAVKQFQSSQSSLTDNGVVGSRTQERLKAEIKKKRANAPLSRGSSGDRVKQLQKDLMELGYDVGSVEANGAFGALTEGAVKKFQKNRKGLVDNGVVGDKTQAELKKALKEKRKPKPKPDTSTGLYRVQVGAYRKREDAERISKELKDRGYDTLIKQDSK